MVGGPAGCPPTPEGGSPDMPTAPIPVVRSWFMEGLGAWKGLGGLGELNGFTPAKDEGARPGVAKGLLLLLLLLLFRLLKEELEECMEVMEVVPVWEK